MTQSLWVREMLPMWCVTYTPKYYSLFTNIYHLSSCQYNNSLIHAMYYIHCETNNLWTVNIPSQDILNICQWNDGSLLGTKHYRNLSVNDFLCFTVTGAVPWVFKDRNTIGVVWTVFGKWGYIVWLEEVSIFMARMNEAQFMKCWQIVAC